MKQPNALREALHYAERGIPILPLVPGAKIPLIEGGAHAATCCTLTIREWWREWPLAELALACGTLAGFDVLDVDKQHGGIEQLELLENNHSLRVDTVRQCTPSGGFHLLFRHHPGLKNRCGGQRDVPPGLDCRTTGAMIRTSPTPGYHWTTDWSLDDLQPWPPMLADFYKEAESSPLTSQHHSRSPTRYKNPGRYFEVALQGLAAEIEQAVPGSQNATLNAASFRAGRLLASETNADLDTTAERLIAAGRQMENQPKRRRWTTAKIEEIVRRALKDGQSKGRT